MKSTQNTKSPMLDTAGKTQSYHYGNTSNSPPQSVSFRQSPSPSNLKTFTHNKDQLLNNYPSRQSLLRLSTSPPVRQRGYLNEDIDQVIIQHRMQAESLLLEIGRLQQQLHQSHELRLLQSKSIRQQYDQILFAQSSQQRQAHQAQIQAYQLQIRRIKEQLQDKSDETKRLHELLHREKQSKEVQKKRFNEEVHQLIEKKNSEIFQQRQEGEAKFRQLQELKKNQVDQIRYNLNKQIRNLNSLLEQRRDEIERIKTLTERQQKQKMRQIEYLKDDLQAIQKRSEQKLSRQMEKYDNIRTKFNQLIAQFSEIGMKSRSELQQLFQAEYNQLIVLLKANQAQNQAIKRQKQAEISVYSKENEDIRTQNQLLQKKVKEATQNAFEDIELLKVKLAALHQKDITQIQQLYELKLKNMSGNIYRMDQQNSKLRQLNNLLSAEKYQTKKNYEITISELNSRLLKMRMGMSNMESDFREKIQNQKSLMLMTSKSFLKQAEAKNSNHKFLEQEIRKLRQLMDLQSRENQNSQKVVEQRIQAANYELQQLSNRVLSIAKEKKELEEYIVELRKEKDQQITKLRAQLSHFQVDQKGAIPQLRIIEQQRHQLANNKQQISILKDKIHALQSRMKQMDAERQRLQMQNNIHIDQAKKEFHVIAEQHLKEFKSYYQEKLKVVEEQKGELKKIISSQYEKITDLIKKYKQQEESLKEATKMMKKRTELQQKVMNIGLDTNLVKNLAQLLPAGKNH